MVMEKKSIKLEPEIVSIIENIAKKEGSNFGTVTRRLIKEALNTEWCRQNEDILAALIRQQMDIVIKPHIERLAALSAKGGHMSATAAYLNLMVMDGFVPPEKREELVEAWQSSRKKAVSYMKSNIDNIGDVDLE